jgi:zinc transport system substrate-binding protein
VQKGVIDMNKRNLILLVGLALLAGCSKNESTQTRSEKPSVATVNYPLAYFAERIAGDRINVHFPAMEGDPAFWMPSPEQILAYQKADLILLNGAAYAKWVPKVSLPPAKLIDTAAGFKDQYIAIDGATSHAHGSGKKHAHGEIAFTVWLDPLLAIQQAATIRDAFSSRWNEHAAEFNTNFQALEKELTALDEKLKQAFAAYGDEPIIGSHPVYQYLTRRYGLNMKTVHWEPDSMPDATMQRELDDLLEAFPARTMLWEGVPEQGIQLLVEKKGLNNRVFDPCGNRPAVGNYFKIMHENIRNLETH